MSEHTGSIDPCPKQVPLAARSFETFALPGAVRAGLRDAGFTHCTPIQERTLPSALAGRDVAGQAQTGTGKTAAFLLTLFTRLVNSGRRSAAAAPRALVIAPTRELAMQIAADAELLGSHTGLVVHTVYGGVDYRKQRDLLTGEVDVLIGTPGRLIDYLKQKVYRLDAIEALVIDEADRLFDMGFIRDLRFLLRRLPPYHRRQSLLFSATLSWEVMELAYEFMNDPERVTIAPEQITAENVEHIAYHVGKHEKLGMLLGVLRREAGDRTLIFTNMKRTAERLPASLEAHGMRARAITGDIEQTKRIKVLADFREGRLPILVATDVASRGLHIPDVTHVINYDLPQDPEDYVHRIGRTARAGASGKAVSLICEDYVDGLEPIERFIGFKIPFAIPGDDLYVSPAPLAHHHGREPHRAGHSRARHYREHRPPRPQRRASGSAGEAAPAPSPPPSDASAQDRPRRRRRRGSRRSVAPVRPAVPS